MRLIATGLAAGRLNIVPTGLEDLPSQGPVILVARHYHHLFDGVALYSAVPRPLHILVAIDWATNPFVRRFFEWADRLARWPVVVRPEALRSGATQFSEREVLSYQRTAFEDSVKLLTEGRVLAVFPEGFPTVDPHFTPKKSDDEILPFKKGFLRICRAAERNAKQPIPLVPVGLRYEGDHPSTVHIRFGTPLFTTDSLDGKALVRKLEEEVSKLSSRAVALPVLPPEVSSAGFHGSESS